MKRALAIAAVLTLSLSGTAHASWQDERAAAIAEVVWNHCANELVIGYANPATRGLPAYVAGWADEGGCTVMVNPEHDAVRYWETFCTEVIHEAGHAARFRDPLNAADPYHSHLPDSVMYGQQTASVSRTAVWTGSRWRRSIDFDGTDRRCRDRGRPYLIAHGAMAPAQRDSAASRKAARKYRQSRHQARDAERAGKR